MHERRADIIALLRGQVACPVLANLAEFGWLEEMSKGSFTVTTFPDARPTIAKSIFKYLAALGLIVEAGGNPDQYVVSDFGRSVFARSGSFCILNSYEDLFQDLRSLLFDHNSGVKPVVNRLRNVLGSGQLHSRKFFSPALKMLDGRSFPFLVDLGCGNGQFLEQAVEVHLSPKIAGVDLSAVALTAAASKINGASSGLRLHTVEADACGVQMWSDQLPWYHEAGLFSMWFVLHEFSQHDPIIILKFLREINSRYPSAELIIGELVRPPTDALASNRKETVMPEFLFFHELSGQGVLSWKEWQDIRSAMPFQIIVEHCLDSLLLADGSSVPSSFIWHLRPI